MKKIDSNIENNTDELLPEYIIDYSKAKRNPYYQKDRTFIELDSEVANVFKTSEQVNRILKAILKSMPKNAEAL